MGASCVLSIPLIFSAVALHHKAFTSPNPPPKSTRNYDGIVDRTLFRSIGFVTLGQKGMAWLVGGAEAAVILAKNIPNWKYSTSILKHLVPNGNFNQIGELDLYFCIGTGLIIAGGALRWSCYRALGKMFTYEVAVQKEHKLVTSGPYGIVRHPSYTGILLIIAGLFIWQGGPNSFMRQSGMLASWTGKAFAAGCALWLGTLGFGGVSRAHTEDVLLFPYIY